MPEEYTLVRDVAVIAVLMFGVTWLLLKGFDWLDSRETRDESQKPDDVQ